jgi:hypothetical protein
MAPATDPRGRNLSRGHRDPPPEQGFTALTSLDGVFDDNPFCLREGDLGENAVLSPQAGVAER